MFFKPKKKKVSEAMFQSQMKVVGNNERKKNRILYFWDCLKKVANDFDRVIGFLLLSGQTSKADLFPKYDGKIDTSSMNIDRI